jgi:hypothetical protein
MMADRRELQGRLRQWEEDVGSRSRGPDERARPQADPKLERKPGEPDLLTRQRAFEEEFAAIQVRRFRLQQPPERRAEISSRPPAGPPAAPASWFDMSLQRAIKALRPLKLKRKNDGTLP